MSLKNKFENIGGRFFTEENELKKKLENIRAFIFDWDGVFNDGTKTGEMGSPFAEPDSMGVNMLRFSYWLKNGELPFVYIITGEKNKSAIKFAEREHFHGIFLNYKSKKTAIQNICETQQISPNQIAFFFDDIIDLDAAEVSGISINIPRRANPLFSDYLIENKLCDYMTGHTGGDHAIREATELLIGLNGNYAETISKRVEFSGAYEKYLSERNAVATSVSKFKL